MTSITSFRNALQLNNKGVSLLLASKDTEAITCLRGSLNIFQQLLYTFNTDTPQENDSSSPAIEMDSARIPISSNECSVDTNNVPPQVQQNTIIHSKTVSLPFLQNKSFFIYDKAIRFDISEILSSHPKQNDIHLFIATVILNVALAYHRQAALGKKLHRTKAKSMYDMVSTLLFGRDFDIRYRGSAFLLSVAAINNLSSIRYEEGHYEISIEGFHHLGYLLSTQHHNKNNFSLHGVNCNDDIIGMSLNVFVANRPTIASAA